MRCALFLALAARAIGAPTATDVAASSAAETAAFYSVVGTATAAATPNSAPVIGNASEVVGVDPGTLSAAVSSVVTGLATPIDGSTAVQSAAGHEPTTTSKGKKSTSTTARKTTSSSYGSCRTRTSTVQTTATTATTKPTTSSTTSYVSVPTTCTPVSWTNTNSYTSTSACPTAIEVGTYCGFINPLDPCASQLAGAAPSPTADTVAAFLADKGYQALASDAATPSGYVSTFTDLDAAVVGNTYLGYETLTGYDPSACAAFCDATDLCTGFNIYIERDPGWNPDQCSCADPVSTYNFKCSIFAGGVYATAATNAGQYRDDFEVAITASNGYMVRNTTADSTETGSGGGGSSSSGGGGPEPCLPSGCSQPHSCWGRTHVHPETLLKEGFFPGAFDVDACVDLAAAQSAANLAADVNVTAAFLNAALVVRDGVAWGTYCGLFAEQYGSDDCTWSPGSSGGYQWSVQDSWGVDLDVGVLLGS